MRALALALVVLSAIDPAGPAPARRVAEPTYPFAVGEEFEYAAKLGILRLGTATMAVTGIDTVRGVESFVFQFGLEAKTIVYRTSNIMRSWAGTTDLVSRRFHQDLDENGKIRQRYYEIYPDSGIFRQQNKPAAHETPAEPLDDAAFFYFIRTTPLEVGKAYEYHRYFKKELNPVKVKVLKREEMQLPDDQKVKCLVLNPVVGDQGIFGPQAEAKLWLSDDARRIPVQIRSRLPFGTVTLRLIEMKLPGPPPPLPPPAPATGN